MLRRKKAFAHQVDWAISLSIFLMFIFWFFIVLRVFAPETLRMETTIQDIEEKFKNNVSFEYVEIPIYVESSGMKNNYPVLIKSPSNWTSYVLGDNTYYETVGDNILFISDLNNGINKFDMIRSENNYSVAYPVIFLYNSSDNIVIDSKSFVASYPDYIFKEIYYNSTQLVYDFNASVNDGYVDFDASPTVETVYAMHEMDTDWFTISSFMFPDQSFIKNIFDVSNTMNNNATFSLEIITPVFDTYKTQHYEIDHRISFDYQQCFDILNKSTLNLKYGDERLMLKFNKNIDFELCDASNYSQDLMKISMDFDYTTSDITRRTEFFFYAHNDNFNTASSNLITSDLFDIGIKQKMIGASKSRIFQLNSKTNDELFSFWNISDDKEFQISVMNSTADEIFSFQSADPGNADVFTKTFSDFLIDKYGNKKQIFVSVGIW